MYQCDSPHPAAPDAMGLLGPIHSDTISAIMRKAIMPKAGSSPVPEVKTMGVALSPVIM